MTTFFYDKTQCPHCGYEIDCASVAADGKDVAPSAGDVSLCIRCAGIMLWADRFTLRKPTEDEEAEIGKQEMIVRIRREIRAYWDSQDRRSHARHLQSTRH